MKKRPGTLVPAAARPSGTGASKLTPEELDLSTTAVLAFEAALGGRAALIDALAVAQDAPDVARVVDLLLDPRYDRCSLRRLCTMAGLTIADFFLAYKKATLVRAHIEAAPIIARKLVGIVDDLMTRAQPHYVPCSTCRGTGTVVPEPTRDQPNPRPEPCRACTNGQVLLFPDLDRQKLALEVAELIKPRASLTFNQANVLAPGGRGPTAPGALEQLQQAASAILFARPAAAPPVAGEVIESDPPPPVPST